jgi:hypothetical protein
VLCLTGWRGACAGLRAPVPSVLVRFSNPIQESYNQEYEQTCEDCAREGDLLSPSVPAFTRRRASYFLLLIAASCAVEQIEDFACPHCPYKSGDKSHISRHMKCLH